MKDQSYDVVNVPLDEVGIFEIADQGTDIENLTVLQLPQAAVGNCKLRLSRTGKGIPLELVGQPFVWLRRPNRRGCYLEVTTATPGVEVCFFVGYADSPLVER